MNLRNILFILMLGISGTAAAQGIDFFHGTWEEAKAKAKETDKLIFVDAYTTWCGPCKRMARDIFPLEEVGKFYNSSFINYKLDMEKGEGPAFASKYKVSAYPTFVFVDGDGNMIFNRVGGSDQKGFILMGSTALEKYDRSPQFAAKYDAGDRSPELIYDYIKALNASGKSSLKVANEFLNTQPNNKSDIYYKIIFESAVSSDSKPFSLLLANEKPISRIYTGSAYDKRIYAALINSVNKGIEYDSPGLIEDALVTAKKTLDKENNKIFAIQVGMIKADAVNDGKDYVRIASELKSEVSNKSLIDLEAILRQLQGKYSNIPEAKSLTGPLFSKYADISEDPTKRLEYAIYLHMNNDKEKALKEAKLARAEAEKKQLDTTKYDNTILKISSN